MSARIMVLCAGLQPPAKNCGQTYERDHRVRASKPSLPQWGSCRWSGRWRDGRRLLGATWLRHRPSRLRWPPARRCGPAHS